MGRQLTDEQREAKNAYNRAYRAANLEKVRAKERERYAKKAERINAARRAKRAENPEAVRAKMRDWYARNRDSANAKKRAWRTQNAERLNEIKRARYAAASAEERRQRAEKRRVEREARLALMSDAEKEQLRKHNAQVARQWRWRTGRTPETAVSARYLQEFRYGEYAEVIESARDKLKKWYYQ